MSELWLKIVNRHAARLLHGSAEVVRRPVNESGIALCDGGASMPGSIEIPDVRLRVKMRRMVPTMERTFPTRGSSDIQKRNIGKP